MIADNLTNILEIRGYDASDIYSAERAIEQRRVRCPDGLIANAIMEPMNGVQLAVHLAQDFPSMRVLLHSSNRRTATRILRTDCQGHNFATRPHAKIPGWHSPILSRCRGGLYRLAGTNDAEELIATPSQPWDGAPNNYGHLVFGSISLSPLCSSKSGCGLREADSVENWAIIFRNLYTGFVLRDFAGKIVPGAVLLFSVACLFRQPKDVFSELRREVPIFLVLILAGLAWTVTLGTQSLAEGLGIWSYFPGGGSNQPSRPGEHSMFADLFDPAPDPGFDRSMLEVDEFQSRASEDEKQQYERYVVIKEACGNLFNAMVLSLPLWVIREVFVRPRAQSRFRHWPTKGQINKAVLVCYSILVLIGLHRMHLQHVYRQLHWAQDVTARHKTAPQERPTSVHLEVEQK